MSIQTRGRLAVPRSRGMFSVPFQASAPGSSRLPLAVVSLDELVVRWGKIDLCDVLNPFQTSRVTVEGFPRQVSKFTSISPPPHVQGIRHVA